MKNNKIFKICIITLIAICLIVFWLLVALLINKNSNLDNEDKLREYSNLDNEDKLREYSNLDNEDKLREYSKTLTEFNCQDAISIKGYISEDDALKIVATSTISRDGKQIEMEEYLENINSINIEFVENNENISNNSTYVSPGDIKSQGTYWKIILRENSSSYIETAQFNISYYTGEILFGAVTSQLNID